MIVLAMLIMLLTGRSAWGAPDLSAFAYDQRLGSQLPPDTPFQDEQGRAVTLRQMLAHRPTILALGYFHCPNLCGLVRDDLVNALAQLDRRSDYNLIVLSIDPSETPADAAAARTADLVRFDPSGTAPPSADAATVNAGMMDAAAADAATVDWHYLTGNAAGIAAITDAVGFRSRFDPQQKQFLHPSGIVFLTTAGSVSSYLLGLGYQPSDVGLGITRAANGITARALPILLLCFHYDPTTGRYTLAIMRILQLGAAITVLVIGGTVILALRREGRSQ